MQDVLAHGRDKLLRKGADAIVLNDISREGLGFDSNRNAAVFLTEDSVVHIPESSKDDIAAQILDQVPSLRSHQVVALQLR